MSLLIQYCYIPHYFCFSFVSFLLLIHCHASHWHDLCMSLHNHLHVMLAFVWPITSCFIGLALCVWWTDELWTSLIYFCFLVYPSYPVAAWLITSCCAMQSGTYCSFISDDPCAQFLVYHWHLTHLYSSYNPENTRGPFSPRVQTEEVCSTWSLCPFLIHTFASLHTFTVLYTSLFPHFTSPWMSDGWVQQWFCTFFGTIVSQNSVFLDPKI